MYTAVIPTKNRPEDLKKMCMSLLGQTIQPNQIIIIDQSEFYQPLDVSNSVTEINHIHLPNVTGLTQAKNVAVSKAKNNIIFFFDDDIICDPDFCETILKHFKDHPEYYGICGRQKNSKSSRFKVIMFDLFHRGAFKDIRKKCNSGYITKSLIETNVLPGGITAYRKEVFDDFSFDEKLIKYCLGEDMDFSYRVYKKYKLAFATDALALHNHSQIGRYDPIESFACKVAGYSYFYEKNVEKNIYQFISYLLVNLGIVADACAYSVKHKNLDAIKGYIKGREYLKNKYQGVPFIDTNQGE